MGLDRPDTFFENPPEMDPDAGTDVTALLAKIRANDPTARNELLSQLYDELRKMAASLLMREPPGHTLQTTALLHEALQRLLGSNVLEKAPDRCYLFAAVHRAMRQVLTDYARQRSAKKRGGAAHRRVSLDEVLDRITTRWSLSELDLVAIAEALDGLEKRNARQRLIVDLKIFSSLSNSEVARQLSIAESTVERDFRLARAYLSRQLAG